MEGELSLLLENCVHGRFSSKTGDAKLDYIFYNNAQKIETQAKNLLKMEERLREVLYEMNFETLKQSHR